LSELEAERRRIDRAIIALQKIVRTGRKEKRSTRLAGKRRPAQPRTLKIKDHNLQHSRGKLLLFRKPRKMRSKPSHAEEA
jgi:hypothetical protein